MEDPDRSSITLISEIDKNVKKGITTYFDCWRAYNAIEGNSYQNLNINHNFYTCQS